MGYLLHLWTAATLLVWLAVLCLKEYCHALVAERAGLQDDDLSPREVLNPLRHEEPLITLGLPLLMLAMLGVGMSGPALSVERIRMRGRWKETAIYLAGPIFHAALASLLALPAWFGLTHPVVGFCSALSVLNLEAFFFTLIPLPPFDTYRALVPWLPTDLQYYVNRAVGAGMMCLAAWWATASDDMMRGGATIFLHFVTFLRTHMGIADDHLMPVSSPSEAWVRASTFLLMCGAYYLITRPRDAAEQPGYARRR